MVWLWVCVYGVEGRETGEGRKREKGGRRKVCHTNIDHKKKPEVVRLFIEVNYSSE